MKPFVDLSLLAIGPWIVPVALLVLIALALLAGFLIDAGIDRKSPWRIALGVAIAAAIVFGEVAWLGYL